MNYHSLFDLWVKICSKYKDKIAFINNNGSVSYSYSDAFRMLCYLTEKFEKFGLKKDDHVSIFTSNSPEWLIIEQAVINLNAVCIAKSPEIVLSELIFVLKQSDSCALITDNIELLDIAKDYNLKFIIYSSKEQINLESYSNIYSLKDILSEFTPNTPVRTNWVDHPDDIAYISYTSGTSSQPKGAILKNKAMVSVIDQLEDIKTVDNSKAAIVTCHISSMGWKAENLIYWALGCKTIYTHYKEFYPTIEKFRPAYFQIPPKILLTIHQKLFEFIQKQNIFYRLIFNIQYKISLSLLFLKRKYPFLSSIVSFFDKIADIFVYKKIRNSMFNDGALFDVGSAPLCKSIEDFFQIIGITIVQSYGATETAGIAIGNSASDQKLHPYSIGKPFKYNTVKIVSPETFEEVSRGEKGILIIKGPSVLEGYYKNEEAEKKALLADRFYNTWDLAVMDKDGYITILSRYDDVIVMSNGYNVYTRQLENMVKDSEYINQIVIIGQGKPYLTAIVVPNKNYFDSSESNNKEFLLQHINDKISKKENYKYYEKIKDIYITKDDFTVENGLLAANTLKIYYNKVYKLYINEIENMYKDTLKNGIKCK